LDIILIDLQLTQVAPVVDTGIACCALYQQVRLQNEGASDVDTAPRVQVLERTIDERTHNGLANAPYNELGRHAFQRSARLRGGGPRTGDTTGQPEGGLDPEHAQARRAFADPPCSCSKLSHFVAAASIL
jgi:hypothetical protein